MAPNNSTAYPLMILDAVPPVKKPVKVKPAKLSKPFWGKKSFEWSSGLPLCGSGDLADIEEEMWGVSDTRLASGSWFSVNVKAPETFSGIAGHVSGPIMEKLKDQAKGPLSIRGRMIRILPTPDQKSKFLKFFDAVRFCYNMLVSKFPDVWKGGVTLKGLREVARGCPEWMNQVPFHIKDTAVRDFQSARTAHFAKLKKVKKTNPNATNFAKFKFRSKFDHMQSFEVHSQDFYRDKGMYAFLNLRDLESSEPIPDHIGHSVRFVMTRDMKIYICIPTDIPLTESMDQEKAVALDPGVRTFQTTYDSSGKVTEWGAGDMTKIARMCFGIDRLQGKWSKAKGKKRWAIKKAWGRAVRKIQNLVKEVHRNMAKWLCENYRVILIPEFETQDMVKKARRKIGGRTARAMMTWSHFAFRQTLVAKAETYDNVRVIVCDEQYTSKTCGKCGQMNQTLGGSKVFRCPDRKGCGHVSDRDVNAARNIMIRYLTLKRCKAV